MGVPVGELQYGR